MSLTALLEGLARDTWERVRDGHALGIHLGETGLTDLLLLEIKRRRPPNLQVFKTPHNLESSQGTDWEWWIGSPQIGWLRYAVQAKKLYLHSRTYQALGHKVAGVRQVDILDTFANANRAIPIYCFYNYADWVNLATCWQCNLPRDDAQLGCTITPSFIVRNALAGRRTRSFESIHSSPQTIPWRCLLKCPVLRLLYSPGTVQGHAAAVGQFGQEVHVFDALPPTFAQASELGLLPEFLPDYYSGDAETFPKRVMVVDISQEEPVPVVVDAGAGELV